MKRTQLQLDEPTYQVLRRRAFEQGVSMAAIIRRAIAKYLGTGPRGPKSPDSFKFVGSGPFS